MYIVRRHIFCKLLIFLGFSCIFHLLPAQAQNESGGVLKKVVIDPGHGGPDPGALGAKSREKDIVLDISQRLGKMIRQEFPDIEVIYTRKTDVLIPLDKRGDIANKAQANLFISIHANANPKKSPYGTETFVMGYSKSAENMEVAKRENSAILIEDDYSERYEGFDPNSSESYIYFSLLQNAYQHQSLGFAAEIQGQFKTHAKRTDRGVKQANFLVLWKTSMPSVLVEVGFISNAEEEKYINSNAGKDQLATSIFKAFCSYKAMVEDRSSFKSDNIQGNEIQEKPATTTASSETTVRKSESAPSQSVAGKKVEFCVQIATSPKPMNTDPNNFKKYKNVERIQTSPNFYKYIIGRTDSYNEAQENMKKARADFKDAFVVGIVNGKIVPVADALKLAK